MPTKTPRDSSSLRSPSAQSQQLSPPVDRVGSVIEFIIARIRTGEYVQGQQIVARTIANTLGISVAPVREALHRLSGEGIIELHSNRSARVRQLSLEEILNALEVWEVHGALMARLVAERIKIRDNADRVRAATKKIHQARKADDLKAYSYAVIALQETLTAITENPYVEAVRKQLHTEFWTPQLASIFPAEHRDEYLANFDKIESAILSGDPVRAARTYAHHSRWVADRLRDTYSSSR